MLTEVHMIDRMQKISDLALDMGAFELDNELETGLELSQRIASQRARTLFSRFEIHQEAPHDWARDGELLRR